MKKLLYVSGVITNTLFILFWIVVFILFQNIESWVMLYARLFEYINVGFIVLEVIIGTFFLKLTIDSIFGRDDAIIVKTSDKLLYSSLPLVIVLFLVFEFSVSGYCNMNTIYLSAAEELRYYHIPWLILGNYIIVYMCCLICRNYYNIIDK